MKRFHRFQIKVLASACLLAGSVVWAQAPKPSDPVTLNFVNAEIEAVARTLSSLSGRNLVVDPRVKGTINLSTEKPVSPNAAWNQFLAVLRLQGFAVIETNGLYKVVPEADAKLQGGSVAVVPNNVAPSSGQVMTQLFRLNHENANNLVAVLRPLISPNNTINVNPGTNTLVITDYADNLQRMGRIIEALDVSNASDVEVIPLKFAIASDLVPLLTRLVEASGGAGATAAQGQTDTSYKTTILAESRSNAVIIRAANAAKLSQARALVEKLDKPNSASASGNIHVVYLKNADATKLAVTLRAAMASSGNTSGLTGTINAPTATPSAPGAPGTSTSTTTNASTTGGQIQADAATNSLIITASLPQYQQLREVIDRLDQRRAQVLVESLIAEVNASKAAQLGIQWQNITGQRGGTVGVLGTNFGSGGNNILSLSTQGASGGVVPGTGLNIATAKYVDGKYVLASLANFLETNVDGNVLSTPTLMTLDNEEAKIVVGQNVPFATGQYTNNNAALGSVNPFQTYERKDVGLTLRIKPQISETGTVKLTVFQEVSNVVKTASDTAQDRVLSSVNKRSIESNVLVEDGGVVVLGGLLSDEYTDDRNQVPGLGNVPFLGWLFKNENRARKKTNLMIFLRPVVVRDAASSEALTNLRYQQMLNIQQSIQPTNNPVLDVGASPTLPPAPTSTPTPAK